MKLGEIMERVRKEKLNSGQELELLIQACNENHANENKGVEVMKKQDPFGEYYELTVWEKDESGQRRPVPLEWNGERPCALAIYTYSHIQDVIDSLYWVAFPINPVERAILND